MKDRSGLNLIVSFSVGFVFALGLGISGMTQPQKVVGFLDLFGNWDPSLMFVMMGAIAVHFISYRAVRNRKSPLLSSQWHIPTRRELTPTLVIGSTLFGIGWGLAGYCPGPAVTSLASLEARPVIFVVSMIIGMAVFNFVEKRLGIIK